MSTKRTVYLSGWDAPRLLRLAAFALLSALLLFWIPIPLPVSVEVPGVLWSESDPGLETMGTLRVNGWLLCRLFRTDGFTGRLSICSGEPYDARQYRGIKSSELLSYGEIAARRRLPVREGAPTRLLWGCAGTLGGLPDGWEERYGALCWMGDVFLFQDDFRRCLIVLDGEAGVMFSAPASDRETAARLKAAFESDMGAKLSQVLPWLQVGG